MAMETKCELLSHVLPSRGAFRGRSRPFLLTLKSVDHFALPFPGLGKPSAQSRRKGRSPWLSIGFNHLGLSYILPMYLIVTGCSALLLTSAQQ